MAVYCRNIDFLFWVDSVNQLQDILKISVDKKLLKFVIALYFLQLIKEVLIQENGIKKTLNFNFKHLDCELKIFIQMTFHWSILRFKKSRKVYREHTS